MNKSEIILLSKLELSNPVFLGGLSSFDGIGPIVTQMFIEHTKAGKFAELYSPHFPDYAIVEEDGLCHLPRYEFYTNEHFQPNHIILTGTVRPMPEDTVAHYEIFHSIFNFAKEMGCKRFITFGNFATTEMEREIYIASTSEKLSKSITEKLGGKIFGKGRIDGLIGMVLGLARLQNLSGLCILGASLGDAPYETMASPVFGYLLKALEFEEK